MIEIDDIILGDNQFFGVNHKSEDVGRKTEAKFKHIEEVQKILYAAKDNGVKAVFFSTHPLVYKITDMIRKDTGLRDHFSIYVNVPYITKYARMISEMGVYKTVKTVTLGRSFLGKIMFFAKAGWNVLTQNYFGIINRLVDVELSPFRGLKIKAIFLHDALCDLLLGYEMHNVLRHFYDYVKKEYKVIPGFGTFNYPKMSALLDKAGINEALVMAAVNKNGFFMNPSKFAVEMAIKNSKHTILAMSTLAAGSLKIDEAYEYISSLQRVRSVVVGLSTEEHAKETFGCIRKYLSIS